MNDKQMLEFAAKAAGVLIYFDKNGHSRYMRDRCDRWSPLTDDGDALRLAVKLKIPMQFTDWEDKTRTWGLKDGEPFDEPHEDDPDAATRRAITRAAAEIGRAL